MEWDEHPHRWGHRIFESSVDIEMASRLNKLFPYEPIELNVLVTDRDRLLEPELRANLHGPFWKLFLECHIAQARGFFNGGLSTELYDQAIWDLARDEPREMIDPDRPGMSWRKWRIIIGCALLMRCGAIIPMPLMQLLNNILRHINTRPEFDEGEVDDCFREPGRLQFLNCLYNYRGGQPVDWSLPSCYNCGKMERQLGYKPLDCTQCHRAWYCDKECQSAHWEHHTKICFRPSDPRRSFWV